MPTMLDPTDVPPVQATEMARLMRHMIDNGYGLVMLRGLSGADMDALESATWDGLEGDYAQRRATLVRFRSLVDVFAARRLRDLMLRRGFRIIAPALQIAAGMRLNLEWGFSPQKFNLALRSLVHELEAQPQADAQTAVDLAA